MNDDKVIRLAAVNNDVRTEGKAAGELVAAFLREWADAIERGDEDVHRAVLVMYNKLPDGCFRVMQRRCNVDFLEAVGLMQLALTDLATATD